MKSLLNILVISLLLLSCSSPFQFIKLDIRDNQLFVQDKETTIDDFEIEVDKLTKDLTKEELRKVQFSITIDGKSKVGMISDLKAKKENWKRSKSIEMFK